MSNWEKTATDGQDEERSWEVERRVLTWWVVLELWEVKRRRVVIRCWGGKMLVC